MLIIHLFKLNHNNVESVWINTDIQKNKKKKPKTKTQAYLKDIVGLVPDHHNKANIPIK